MSPCCSQTPQIQDLYYPVCTYVALSPHLDVTSAKEQGHVKKKKKTTELGLRVQFCELPFLTVCVCVCVRW